MTRAQLFRRRSCLLGGWLPVRPLRWAALSCALLLLAALLAAGRAPAAGSTAARASSCAGAPAHAEGEARHAVLDARRPATRVARAPLVQRLPFTGATAPLAVIGFAFARAVASKPSLERRRELLRLQTRRRVPRMNSEEPPWARASALV